MLHKARGRGSTDSALVGDLNRVYAHAISDDKGDSNANNDASKANKPAGRVLGRTTDAQCMGSIACHSPSDCE